MNNDVKSEIWVLVYSEYQCVPCYTCLSSQDGDSALMIAASKGDTEVVVELVKAGANLNLQNEVQWCELVGGQCDDSVHVCDLCTPSA